MSLEMLTPFAQVDLSQPEFDGLFDLPENVDASGGALAVDLETSALVYTAADGSVMQTALDLPAGFELSDTSSVVIGEGFDQFVVAINSIDEMDGIEGVYTYGLIEVGLDDAGAPQPLAVYTDVATATARPLSNESPVALGPDFFLSPMGDGRVAFKFGDNSYQTIAEEAGYFTLTEDGIDMTVLSGSYEDTESYSYRAADGDNVFEYFLESGFELASPVSGIRYLDPLGEPLGFGLAEPEIEGAFTENLSVRSAAIDEDGNLIVYVYDREEGIDYVATYDIPPLEGDDSDDSTDPTEGDDVISAGLAGSFIEALGGNDIIDVAGPKSTVFGGDGDDQITTAGDETSVFGGQGDDTIKIVGPQTTVNGDDGDDIIEGVGPGSTVFGDAGNDDLMAFGLESTVFGGLGDDTLFVDGLQSTVFGGEGDDTITIATQDVGAFGDQGNDTLNGGADDNELYGGAGQDTIFGGDGNDLIRGGAGDDVTNEFFEGGLQGGAGDDTIFGGDGIDYIDGGSGNDDLRGGAGDDEFFVPDPDGGVSDNEGGMYGGEGDDFMRGNAGFDIMFGDGGNDDMNGGTDTDDIYGGDGDDKLAGYDGDDFLDGDDGSDRMHGGRGDDQLDGGAGDDTLRGADGDDRLEGGEGDDLLIGGAGEDRFYYQTFEDGGTDTVKDFTAGEDKIAFFAFQADNITFDDLFLSQEDSFAVIQAGDTTIRLKGVDAEDLTEDDFTFF